MKKLKKNLQKSKNNFKIKKLKEFKPKHEILIIKAIEREEDDFKKSELNKIAIINKRNKKKQKKMI